MSDTAKPPASITVTVDGAPREIFMSFNNLHRLTYLIGDISALQEVMMNHDVQMAIVLDLVKERDDKGAPIKEYTADSLRISIDDTLELLDFAQEHILDFFMRAAQKATRLTERAKRGVEQLGLTPTPTGQAS